jgi:hypothetical protein
MEQAKAMQPHGLALLAGALAVWMTGNQNPKDLAMGMVAGLVPMLLRVGQILKTVLAQKMSTK